MRDAQSAACIVLGCGAIGLPIAAALAHRGLRIEGVDINPARVADLAAGRTSMGDPGLAEALRAGLAHGRLRFSTTLAPSSQARVYIVAVPTPAGEDGGMGGRPLAAAVQSVAACAQPGDLVCIRSTTPIGAIRALRASLGRTDLAFAACPDRTIAGQAYAEQFTVPHIIGGLDDAAAEAAEALFGRLGPVVRVPDAETAEAVKLFANAQRDVTFALANQFALLCEATGVDFAAVRRAGAEGFSRFALARAGPVGGPCLSKDLALLLASRGAETVDTDLLTAARSLNASLPGRLADAIDAEQSALSDPAAVAILGLAFKGDPPTEDRRGAFAGALIDQVKARRPEIEIRCWDPVSDAAEQRKAVLTGASIVVLANDHPALAADLAADLAPGAVVFDVTGLLERASGMNVRRLGDGRAGSRAGG